MYGLQRVAIDVRVPSDESKSLIETVGRLPRRTRGEVHGLGAQDSCAIQGEAIQGLAHALPSRTPIDDDVLNPRTQSGRDREHDERQRPDDRITITCDEDVARVVLDDRRQLVNRRRWIRRRQLRYEPRHGIDQFLGRTVSDGHDDCHTSTLPHATPDAKSALNPGFRA